MIALKAHVRDGRIVLDEPADLADGTEVVVVTRGDDHDEIDIGDLERAVAESLEDFSRGDFEDAREFAQRLVSKS